MTSLTLTLVTVGVVLVTLLLGVLVGEAIYRWVVGPTLRKYVGKGSSSSSKEAVFEAGEQLVSEGVEALMERIGAAPVMKCLRRHRRGDWGEVDDEDRRLNELSVGGGERCGFESAYTMEDGTVLRIVTYEDCAGTLLLTEEEYHREGKLYARPVMEYFLEKE